ncbi:hypothetical protein [Bradyrhizobium ottawaense]|uniref:Transcriptional regulator n=1 Tax=Bradyrhizobium ottawaense TaxID=931866 RepID=A0ABY0QH91_9BRAD|nr:hypothetical protein [Bradyrhizobium ottawaense]SDK42225.1 hypothetical protein SAMN05444163_8072 [Bradyrhizobium ottawaense]
MTDSDIEKRKTALREALRRKPGTGLRVTIDTLLAAAELVKAEEAEPLEIGREIWIRLPV